MMMNYCELTEVKEKLDSMGIRYREKRYNGGIFVYVNGLMQIDNPTKKQQKDFYPDVRISLHEGDVGYYVRACGMIYENQSLEKVINHVERWALA